MDCYLRRSGQQWTLARPHHKHAFRLYMAHVREERGQEGEPGEKEGEGEGEGEIEEEEEGNMIPNGDAMILSVPHGDGGTFVASFSHVEDDLYQFVDAYRNTVQIMMSTLDRVSFINRLTD